MNLYRIDILAPSGSYALADILGPMLIRSHAKATAHARLAAAVNDCPTLVTRIKGAGTLTPMRTYYPNGTSVRSN